MVKYVLSIDCGTQSIRAIIFDEKGQMLLYNKQIFKPYFSKEAGWAEQEPLLYWEKVCAAIQQLKLEDPILFSRVGSVAVTTQRDTLILMDEKGKVLRPAILWADQRKALKPRRLSPLNLLAITVIGMKKVGEILSQNTHAHWVQDFEPDIWGKTFKCLQVSGYINYQLTGEFKDGVASQIGHIPFEYKKFRWAVRGSMKSELAQIDREKLVDLVPTGALIGCVHERAARETGLELGVKVIAAGSDKGCETLGVGCLDNDVVSISLGSVASIQTTSHRYYEIQSFIPPFQAIIPGMYNPELQIQRGYWMITWFKHEIAEKERVEAEARGLPTEKVLDEKLAKVPPGAEGLMLQPYWGAAVKNPEAKGAILGFSDVHTRIHIYRAIIEGIGFALYDGMLKIEKKSGTKVQRISISGGGSQSDIICQITADLFKLPVHRVQTSETSSLGASIVGYVANGTYKSFEEAIKGMVHDRDVFTPNEVNVKIYNDLFEKIYKKTYKRLRPLYKALDDIIT